MTIYRGKPHKMLSMTCSCREHSFHFVLCLCLAHCFTEAMIAHRLNLLFIVPMAATISYRDSWCLANVHNNSSSNAAAAAAARLFSMRSLSAHFVDQNVVLCFPFHVLMCALHRRSGNGRLFWAGVIFVHDICYIIRINLLIPYAQLPLVYNSSLFSVHAHLAGQSDRTFLSAHWQQPAKVSGFVEFDALVSTLLSFVLQREFKKRLQLCDPQSPRAGLLRMHCAVETKVFYYTKSNHWICCNL